MERFERDDLPAVPPALDALIEALLSRDPLARPSNAAEVIERLCSVAQLEPERSVYLSENYLGSTAFVAREQERAVLSRAAEGCRQGSGSTVLIEAPTGMGRTRLLDRVRAGGAAQGLRRAADRRAGRARQPQRRP